MVEGLGLRGYLAQGRGAAEFFWLGWGVIARIFWERDVERSESDGVCGLFQRLGLVGMRELPAEAGGYMPLHLRCLGRRWVDVLIKMIKLTDLIKWC